LGALSEFYTYGAGATNHGNPRVISNELTARTQDRIRHFAKMFNPASDEAIISGLKRTSLVTRSDKKL